VGAEFRDPRELPLVIGDLVLYVHATRLIEIGYDLCVEIRSNTPKFLIYYDTVLAFLRFGFQGI